MPEPTDMIMPMLREMREETRQGFDDMRSRLDGLDERLRAVEKLVKAQREAFEGESILGRYAAKEVDERLSTLEQRVAALEARE
jgi:polyhydroxyalkanoate synthesis regulator phasin